MRSTLRSRIACIACTPSIGTPNIARLQAVFAVGLAVVAVGLLLAFPTRVHATEIDPAALRVHRQGSNLTVEGGHFALTWSEARGGDLTSIRVHDGVGWHELVGKGGRRTSVPGILIYGSAGTLGSFAAGKVTVTEASDDRVIVVTRAHPATEGGKRSAVEVRQTYSVSREGAVFVDIELELPEGAPPLTVHQASLGWPVETGDYTLSYWHWQSGNHGSGLMDPRPTFSYAFASNVGLALGTAGNISNQLQMVIESNVTLRSSRATSVIESEPSQQLSTRPIVTWVKDGRHFIFWLHSEGSGPVELTAPYLYRNRWGFLLGRSPGRSRLAGHRIVAWTEAMGTGLPLPSASALEGMARAGASAVLLGEGCLRAGERDGKGVNLAVDEGEFRGFIAAAHAAGLRCLASASPMGEGESLGRWAREIGLDGLYLANASAHYGAIRDGTMGDSDADPDLQTGSPANYPASATFAWGRALRRGLGPDGILIIHTGIEAPDMTLGLLADGVAFGTERAEWRAGSSTLINAYYGGGGYATPCPLAFAGAMRSPRAVAVAAAIAAVPIVPLGEGPKRSAFVGARWVLPLWQILRIMEQGTGIDVRPPGVRSAIAASNEAFWSTVYRLNDEAALLVTANLSSAEHDSSGFALDLVSLGFEGEYNVEVLTADSIENFAVRHAGRTASGRFRTDSIPSSGLRGYLFTRDDASPALARGLDQGLRVARAYADNRPPDPPESLAARPVTLGLELTWSPAGDDQHATSYRIYRSTDPRFQQSKESHLFGEAYEETRYRDLAVSPGETWTYVVTALDVAGNESRPSTTVSATLPEGERSLSFSDSVATLRAFIPQAGTWTPHDSAYGHGCTPDGTPLAWTLLAGVDRDDVDLAVKIWGPAGSLYSGGLICRAVAGGGGYMLFLGGGAASNQIILARWDGKTVTTLASAPFPHGSSALPHTLRLVARGAELVGYGDDRRLVSAQDLTYSHGQVGLLSRAGHVHFDNLTLATPGRDKAVGDLRGAESGASPPKPGDGTF